MTLIQELAIDVKAGLHSDKGCKPANILHQHNLLGLLDIEVFDVKFVWVYKFFFKPRFVRYWSVWCLIFVFF